MGITDSNLYFSLLVPDALAHVASYLKPEDHSKLYRSNPEWENFISDPHRGQVIFNTDRTSKITEAVHDVLVEGRADTVAAHMATGRYQQRSFKVAISGASEGKLLVRAPDYKQIALCTFSRYNFKTGFTIDLEPVASGAGVTPHPGQLPPLMNQTAGSGYAEMATEGRHPKIQCYSNGIGTKAGWTKQVELTPGNRAVAQRNAKVFQAGGSVTFAARGRVRDLIANDKLLFVATHKSVEVYDVATMALQRELPFSFDSIALTNDNQSLVGLKEKKGDEVKITVLDFTERDAPAHASAPTSRWERLAANISSFFQTFRDNFRRPRLSETATITNIVASTIIYSLLFGVCASLSAILSLPFSAVLLWGALVGGFVLACGAGILALEVTARTVSGIWRGFADL